MFRLPKFSALWNGAKGRAAESRLEREALAYHRQGKPGKLAIKATKPLDSQKDLSLAYSPGVAGPIRAIAGDSGASYDYTARGNLAAVVTNGSAVLGLGHLGPLAAKPVMEGKAILFKRFAGIDAFDIEIDATDPDHFVEVLRSISLTFGGLNLEDIRAPDCFVIERHLREVLDIPVFHDDQHGTAIIVAAGILNALDLTGRTLDTSLVVVNGAGAAGIAVLNLLKSMGLPHDNALLCDSQGVVYEGRAARMNEWKAMHAVDTPLRSLQEAVNGADIFIGLSVKGAMTADMVRSMPRKPIIFALANPDPEITPEEVAAARHDAIVATGRSDYPNQVNNVLCFPYIFRGAFDVRATTINEDMKIAAVNALANLAREKVPKQVRAYYPKSKFIYGPDYFIPVPFDSRLITAVPPVVAKAAMESGVARQPIKSMRAYKKELASRL